MAMVVRRHVKVGILLTHPSDRRDRRVFLDQPVSSGRNPQSGDSGLVLPGGEGWRVLWLREGLRVLWMREASHTRAPWATPLRSERVCLSEA